MAQIFNRFSQNLICEDALLDLKQLAERNKNNLRDANLRGVNLEGANLRDARIENKLIKNFKEIGQIGDSKRTLRCFLLDDDSFYFMAGCFKGYEDELKKAVIKKYSDDCEYLEAMEFLKHLSKKGAN